MKFAATAPSCRVGKVRIPMALRGPEAGRDSRRVLASTSKALATTSRAPFGDPPLFPGVDGRPALFRSTDGDRSSDR